MTTTLSRAPRPGLWPANGLVAVIDFAVASHARAVAMLSLVALLAFVPGFFQVAPIDRDEARFAQATKQMLEAGDYIDIRFQNEVRYKKPVGIYWLQTAAVQAGEAVGIPEARTTIWLYRLPSLFGAIGAVLLTYWTALAFLTRRGAVLAGVMMATSILLGVEARLAKTDAMLLLTTLAAMGAMARLYLAEQRDPETDTGWRLPAIFWSAVAGGILLKGPLILMFVGLAVLALLAVDRSGRWLLRLRPLAGIPWMLLLVLPWFAAIIGRAGGSFFTESVGRDMVAKVVSNQESHGAPPGYYFLLFWLTFWPGATLAGLATPAVWAARREAGARFLLAWLVPAWITFELVITKLPHYVLPLYPAIAILIAGAIEQRVLSRKPWLTFGTAWWFALPVLICVAGIVGPIALTWQPAFLSWPFAACSMIAGLLAWRLYDVDGVERSLLRASVSSIFLAFALYAIVLPSLHALFPSPTLARILRDNPGCADPQAASAGYHEPSLVFLAGTSVRLVDGGGAADFLNEGPCRFALVEARQERAFTRRAEVIGLRYAPGPKVEGINISSGRRISIGLYRSEP